MAIHDIFSKRQMRLSGKLPDVYQYDNLPEPLRVQVVHILCDLFGRHNPRALGGTTSQEKWFGEIHNVLAKEYGVFQLDSFAAHSQEAVFKFIIKADVEQVLDVIEVSFSLADRIGEHQLKRNVAPSAATSPEEAAIELNHRFHEHGIGYQYEAGQIVRIDSEFLHQEAVRPALHLLRAQEFSGAEKEFLDAHKKYRDQQYENAIGECLKAFESTLKIICKRKGWPFTERDTAKRLIDTVFESELVPQYLQSQFGSLRTILQSGVPTIRNRDSGHGRGDDSRHVPAYLAAYVLHLTASTILFLAEASTD